MALIAGVRSLGKRPTQATIFFVDILLVNLKKKSYEKVTNHTCNKSAGWVSVGRPQICKVNATMFHRWRQV
jgi:hypothetical protein